MTCFYTREIFYFKKKNKKKNTLKIVLIANFTILLTEWFDVQDLDKPEKKTLAYFEGKNDNNMREHINKMPTFY